MTKRLNRVRESSESKGVRVSSSNEPGKTDWAPRRRRGSAPAAHQSEHLFSRRGGRTPGYRGTSPEPPHLSSRPHASRSLPSGPRSFARRRIRLSCLTFRV